MLLDMHHSLNDAESPVSITDYNDMLIILELMDIGYVDVNAFVIKRKFEDITGLVYKGKFPLTEKGELFLRREGGASHRIYGRKTLGNFDE